MALFPRLCGITGLLALLAVPALAEDLVFTLANNSGFDLAEFYASPADVGDWEEDILGANMLATGTSGNITIADGRDQCSYDLKMVFTDGDEIEDTVDLCETGSYTIN